jgi:hypothetical protein
MVSAVALVAAAVPATATAGAQAPAAAACRTQEVTVTAGKAITLKLDCRVFSGGRLRYRVQGATGRRATAVTTKATRGTLGKVTRNGRVTYRAKSVAGAETIRYTLTAKGNKKYRGAIVVRILAARSTGAVAGVAAQSTTVATPPSNTTNNSPAAQTPADDTPPTTTAPAEPEFNPTAPDGLPAVLPSVAAAPSARAWAPTAYDTCPAALHDRYAVIGPDGLRYPTWHPATVVDPATGRRCTFGHEHGDDPHTSKIFGWVAQHLAAKGYENYAGIPFGLAAQGLNDWAAAHPGTPTRSEDNPGYKVTVANDVKQLGADGGQTGVTCDYLILVHQGSHSADALSNNAHELLYAQKCDDGTAIVSSTLSRFGHPGRYERSCAPATDVITTNNGYPDGGGAREIPDRTCVEENVLVPAGRTTSQWALYERWSSVNTLQTASGETVAAYDTSFGVFNPARYGGGSTGTALARTLPLCWETAADGDRANGTDCSAATGGGTIGAAYGYDDPRSPFNGTHRDTYLSGASIANGAQTTAIWTDPYGGHASTTPFPGALCQLVSEGSDDTTGKTQVFARNRSYNDTGVHAPN